MDSEYKSIKKVVSMVEMIEEDIKEDLEVGMGVFTIMDMVVEVVYPAHVSIMVRLVTSHDFALNHAFSVHIVIVLNM
jgi:hypothetical protein